MATLLCSMLIGAGFAAVVVSGVARSHTVENNQSSVNYPHYIFDLSVENEKKIIKKIEQKYKLREMPDLDSHLDEKIQNILKEKAKVEQNIQKEFRKAEIEAPELKPVDKSHYHRSHAWVAIIKNSPWRIKPKKTYVNKNGDETEELPTVGFIEPSTGLFLESDSANYLLVESVWNNYQYYVNKQNYSRVGDLRWDLKNTADWEQLLPGEPTEMRIQTKQSVENIISTGDMTAEEKYLDTVRSWVTSLIIGDKPFEERFPQQQNIILYKGATYERFSPYTQRDGKFMQLTLYADDDIDYKVPKLRWEHFEHRADLLVELKYNYHTWTIEESFGRGRSDNLKYFRYNVNSHDSKELYFCSKPRLDSLNYIQIERGRIVLHYSDRKDFCCYQEFNFEPAGQVLTKIIEKFKRNSQVPADKDIAVRTFYIIQQKIFLKYHYAKGTLMASTMDIIKPPKPNYGQEVLFDPDLIKFYKANITSPDPTRLQLYHIFLTQLKYEENLKKQFEKVLSEIEITLDQRKSDLENPRLKFNIFDYLRNKAARTRRLHQYAEEEAYQREINSNPADFLAPYLVRYQSRKLNYEESWAAYNACLFDLKSRFVVLLNDLQRQYENLTMESKSLQKFLNRFENQFSSSDYEQLVAEAKKMRLNKRTVQQRLTLTHEGLQMKYEAVKESLMNDSRLNLQEN